MPQKQSLNILAHFIRNFNQLQKLKSAFQFLGFSISLTYQDGATLFYPISEIFKQSPNSFQLIELQDYLNKFNFFSTMQPYTCAYMQIIINYGYILNHLSNQLLYIARLNYPDITQNMRVLQIGMHSPTGYIISYLTTIQRFRCKERIL